MHNPVYVYRPAFPTQSHAGTTRCWSILVGGWVLHQETEPLHRIGVTESTHQGVGGGNIQAQGEPKFRAHSITEQGIQYSRVGPTIEELCDEAIEGEEDDRGWGQEVDFPTLTESQFLEDGQEGSCYFLISSVCEWVHASTWTIASRVQQFQENKYLWNKLEVGSQCECNIKFLFIDIVW